MGMENEQTYEVTPRKKMTKGTIIKYSIIIGLFSMLSYFTVSTTSKLYYSLYAKTDYEQLRNTFFKWRTIAVKTGFNRYTKIKDNEIDLENADGGKVREFRDKHNTPINYKEGKNPDSTTLLFDGAPIHLPRTKVLQHSIMTEKMENTFYKFRKALVKSTKLGGIKVEDKSEDVFTNKEDLDQRFYCYLVTEKESDYKADLIENIRGVFGDETNEIKSFLANYKNFIETLKRNLENSDDNSRRYDSKDKDIPVLKDIRELFLNVYSKDDIFRDFKLEDPKDPSKSIKYSDNNKTAQMFLESMGRAKATPPMTHFYYILQSMFQYCLLEKSNDEKDDDKKSIHNAQLFDYLFSCVYKKNDLRKFSFSDIFIYYFGLKTADPEEFFKKADKVDDVEGKVNDKIQHVIDFMGDVHDGI